MATINTEALDNINAQLEGVTEYIDAYAQAIQTDINNAGTKAQEVADAKMEELSNVINDKLSVIRQKIVDIFSSQYSVAMEKIEPIKPLLDVSLSLDTVVSVVKSIIDIITTPYQPIIEFTTEVAPKVIELSDNLQTIASYQPTIEAPNVKIPPLNIQVEPITPGDITG